MKKGWISHNSVGKQTFERQLSVVLINSIFLMFIITMKILSKSKCDKTEQLK